MTGDQSRKAGGARRISPPTTSRVTSAAVGAAASGVSAGTSVREEKISGITVAAMSMITVPATTGVNTRRSHESRLAIRNWKSDDTTTRLAMVAGPPSTRAATHTAMKAPEVPMMRTCPEPIRPSLRAWRAVVSPLITRAANTAQVMKLSAWSAMRATITTVRTTGATITAAAWRPAPSASARGGDSSGS